MQHFCRLCEQLDIAEGGPGSRAILQRYFRDAPAEDAAWALFFLLGRRPCRVIGARRLRAWAVETAGWPGWLVEESYRSVGDPGETLALLLPAPSRPRNWAFADLIRDRLLPLEAASPARQREWTQQTWEELDGAPRWLWNRLITGAFRPRVSRQQIVLALADVSGLPPAQIAYRLLEAWAPTPASYRRLLAELSTDADLSRPYPFMLARMLTDPVESLGSTADWRLEWKWDGIRAQLIRRAGRCLLWLQSEGLFTDIFPELADAAAALDDGTALDGQIVGWQKGRPLPSSKLVRRMTGQTRARRLPLDPPAAYIAFDLLEHQGHDIRCQPLAARCSILKSLLQPLGAGPGLHDHARCVPARGESCDVTSGSPIRFSASLPAQSWTDVRAFISGARKTGATGVTLRRLDSVYDEGPSACVWWECAVSPFTIDVVLLAARSVRDRGRRGSGRFTFAVWHQGELVPLARADLELDREETDALESYIRHNTIERFGPLRMVRPELVFELAFDDLQANPRRRCGLAAERPRIVRWRKNASAAAACTLEQLRQFLTARCQGSANRAVPGPREKTIQH